MSWIFCSWFQFKHDSNLNRTQDDDMTGVKTINKKALYHLVGHQLVSMQETFHMVDKQELVICSESMTYVSITQGQVLWDELEIDKKQDIITVYWNRKKNTKIILWSNSFTASLSTPHSENQRMITQMTMMKGMPWQVMNMGKISNPTKRDHNDRHIQQWKIEKNQGREY
jgi:hypothetical protein